MTFSSNVGGVSPPNAERSATSLADNDEPQGEEEMAKRIRKEASAWSVNPSNDLFWPSAKIANTLPPGLYKAVNVPNIGPAMRKMIAKTDDIIMVDKDGPMQRVVDEITYFWTDEVRKSFEDRGFLYKRGIMMYGEPGSGKTATVQCLVQEVINRGGIALYTEDAALLIECLQMTRQIQPDIPIVVILEDFEVLTNRGRDENMWLSVMDGESQIDNVVFLATTNYINELDKRFTDRPSRFDVLVPVPMPSALTRATFLRRKEPDMSLDMIKEWIEHTAGYSIAHLKELTISVQVFGKDIREEVARIRAMRRRKFDDDLNRSPEEANKMGISVPTRDELEKVDWDEFARENGFTDESEEAA